MFNSKDVAKMPRRNMSADDFIKLAEIEQESIKEQIRNLDNGAFLAVWFNKKNEKWYRIHLKSIWIKKFDLNYSCHKDTKKGKELLISNRPLPRGPVIKK